MELQFGIAHMWAQGDAVIKFVALLLLAMSLATWVIIIVKTWDLLRMKKHAAALDTFWHSSDWDLAMQKLGSKGENPFLHLAIAGSEAVAHHRQARARLHDALGLSDWLTRCMRNAIDANTARMQHGLAVLASVGSTAPFIGLFGTVWGIYHALLSIGEAGQASIDKVAGPIGEALIMTALGLAVAVPAVLGYNMLVRGNKSVLVRLNSFAHDLHAYFVAGARFDNAHAESRAAVATMEGEA